MSRRWRIVTALAAGAAALVLAGCAAPADFDHEASAELRSRVVAAAQRSAATDYAGAVAELDRLEQSLGAAVRAGEVPTERETAIRDAIALVRTDLDARVAAAIAPEPQPEPAPAPDPGPGVGTDPQPGTDDGAGNGNGNGNGNGDKDHPDPGDEKGKGNTGNNGHGHH